MRPSCSLITSTYNWPEALELVLISIKNQVVLPDEMIIADDGSSQETKALIEHYQQDFPIPLKHVWIEDNGFRKSIVLNMAYAMAKGDYCIQLDGDSIAHPFFIKDHLDFAEKGTFVQGSRVFLIEKKSKKVLSEKRINFKFWSSGIVNRLNAMRIPLLRSIIDKKEASIKGIRGSNTAFWKSDLVAVNGYNEEMIGWGREDSELAARFVNFGLMRRKLKFGAIQYHIYHKEASRNRLNSNDEILEEVISNKIKSCTKGMDQYAG
jgi:glycosyltransferase involved in cell wall biosynthesis